MTQFLLCVPDVARTASFVELHPVAPGGRLFDAAQALLADPSKARVPQMRDGRSVDDIFTEAHNSVYNGGDFCDTQLSVVLADLTDSCASFLAWWSDDWSDLPTFDSKEDLMLEVLDQLRQPIGDVYVRWQKAGAAE